MRSLLETTYYQVKGLNCGVGKYEEMCNFLVIQEH